MTKFYYLLALGLSTSLLVKSQEKQKEGSIPDFETHQEGMRNHCGHDHNENRVANNEIYQSEKKALQDFTKSFEGNLENYRQPDCGYVIPVVFHLHDVSGVTAAQLNSAIEILNEDFNAGNPDFSGIYAPYDAIAADVGISFVMATIDPSGQATNGYTTHSADLGGEEYYHDQNKPSSSWPGNKYLNIWVVNQAYDYSDYSSGWAYLPSTYNVDQGIDGIVFNHRYLGYGEGSSDVSGPESWQAEMGRVLTHEVGHYLNLNHTFYNYCDSQNDNVSDTPPVYYAGSGYCEAYYDGTAVSYCSGTNSVNLNNYMDYSTCPSMYTQGQKTRMLAALNSSIGYRNNLWTCDNQESTGVLGSNVGMNEDGSSSFSVELFPNPSPSKTNLSFYCISTEQVHIKVRDIAGRLVYSLSYTPNGIGQQDISIDAGSIESGVYTVSLVHGPTMNSIKWSVLN